MGTAESVVPGAGSGHGRHRGRPSEGDGGRGRDPRRRPRVARLRGLGLPRRRSGRVGTAGEVVRLAQPRGGDRGAGPDRPQVPSARDDDLRRERRLPAPGPHPLPRGVHRRLPGSRRSGPVPRRRSAVDGVQALLQRRVLDPPDDRHQRRGGRRRPRVALRRVDRAVRQQPASGLRRSAATTHHRGQRLLPAAGRRRCGRTPPRSTRTPTGSRCRTTSSARIWPTEEYELAESRVPTDLPEDDLFAGLRESVQASR